MSFIKDSMKEFDHIVWPTASETQKYFITVVAMITVLTVLLFIVGTALSAGLFGLKTQVNPAASVPTTSAPAGDLKLDDLKLNTTPAPTGTTPTPAPEVKVTPTAPAVPKK